MEKLIRFQVAITEVQFRELEQLMEAGGLKTNRDLLNNAITLLKWAAREKSKGASILSVNEVEGLCKELELPFLEAIAAATQVQHSKKPESDRGLLRTVSSRRSRD